MRHRIGVPIAVTLAVGLLGPRVRVDESVAEPRVPEDVETWLADAESAVANVRAGDAKGIVWADSVAKARTPVALVYLHGFSADRHEIDPVPRLVADALGANLFYTRLKGHGADAEAMGDVSANAWLQDVAEAFAVGRRLGDKVVLMGTSTGGSLAVWAAAQAPWRGDVLALVLVSPNFGLKDKGSRLLLLPWGAYLARAVIGKERCFTPRNEQEARHWTNCYPTRALLPMTALAERVRTMDLATVTTPVLVFYSPNDKVVDPTETERRFASFGGEPKALVLVARSGDPSSHVIAGDIMSPETNEIVVDTMVGFLTPLIARAMEP